MRICLVLLYLAVLTGCCGTSGDDKDTQAAIAFKDIKQPEEVISLGSSPDEQGRQWSQYAEGLRQFNATDWKGTVREINEGIQTDGHVESPMFTVGVDMLGTAEGVDVYILCESKPAIREGDRIVFSGRVNGMWPHSVEPDRAEPYFVEVDFSSIETE